MSTVSLRNEKKNARFCVLLFFLLSRNTISFHFIYNIENIDNLFSVISAATALVVAFYYFVVRFSNLNDNMLIGVCLFEGSLFISTIINEGNLQVFFVQLYPIIGMYCLAQMVFSCKIRKKFFFSILSKLMLLLLIINFIFVMVDPLYFGMGKFFLGFENQISFSLILGLMVVWIDKEYSGSNRCFIMYLVIYTISCVKIWSASGIVGCLIVLACCVVPHFKNFLVKMHFRHIQIFIVVISSLLLLYVFAYHSSASNIFSWFIESFLGKDMSFTGRTYIWQKVFNQFLQKPILGYGMLDDSNIFDISVKIGAQEWITGKFSAHNVFFQLLYNGGILSLFLLLRCGAKIIPAPNTNVVVFDIYKIIVITISVMMMSEAVSVTILFIPLFWAFAESKYSKNYAMEEVYDT